MNGRRVSRGQGLVEFAIILPILLLLLLGVVEMGYLLRNYLVVVNADREACRFAARGRFSDEAVIARAVNAGGVIRINGQDVPILRPDPLSTDPNTAIIVTHIPIDSNGHVDAVSVTTAVSGVISTGPYSVTLVQPSDSTISLTIVTQHQGDATQSINATREAAGYEKMDNNIVVVEIIFMHYPMFGKMLSRLSAGIVPEPPWIIHTHTEMRVVTDRGG